MKYFEFGQQNEKLMVFSMEAGSVTGEPYP